MPRVSDLKWASCQRNGQRIWNYSIIDVRSIVRKVHVVAANESASLSLRHSRGENRFMRTDKEAKFYLNHYMYEAKNADVYDIN